MQRKTWLVAVVTAMVLLLAALLPSAALADGGIVDDGSCGADMTWSLNRNGVLTISGTGAMEDYDSSESDPFGWAETAPWNYYRDTILSIVIQPGVNSIGDYAFASCAEARSITLPSSLMDIGSHALMDCESLDEIALPSGLRNIGSYAFAGCYSLEEIVIPFGIAAIKKSTFADCPWLMAVTIPESVTAIHENAFAYCEDLVTVTYGGSKAQWNDIHIANGNEYLTSASRTYGALSKPEGVKAAAAGLTSVKVSWEKNTDVSGYEVYRAASKSGEYSKIATISKNSTVSYTDKKLSTGKTYYYKVRAYKTAGGKTQYSKYSSIASAKAAPAKIGSVKVAASGATGAKVSWKKDSSATGYEVYRATSKSGKYSKIAAISKNATVSYTDKKLTKGKTYYYKVRAYKTMKKEKVYGAYSDSKSLKIAEKYTAPVYVGTFDIGKKTKTYKAKFYNGKMQELKITCSKKPDKNGEGTITLTIGKAKKKLTGLADFLITDIFVGDINAKDKYTEIFITDNTSDFVGGCYIVRYNGKKFVDMTATYTQFGDKIKNASWLPLLSDSGDKKAIRLYGNGVVGMRDWEYAKNGDYKYNDKTTYIKYKMDSKFHFKRA